MKEAHDRLIERELSRAMESAAQKPPISDKEFVTIWRKGIDQVAETICACPPEYNLDGSPNGCAKEAMDEFMLDLAEPSLRIPGLLDTIKSTQDVAQARKIGREATEQLLTRAVPAKEILRRIEKLRRCMKQAGAL